MNLPPLDPTMSAKSVQSTYVQPTTLYKISDDFWRE
jgi:hypothetical protein